MTEKSHVGMGVSVCPICMREHDEVVLLDKRLQESLTKHEFMGWALCPEHEAMKAEYIALIEVEEKPTGSTPHQQLANAKRTGEIAHVKREVAKEMFRADVPADLELAFVGKGTIDVLRSMTQPSTPAKRYEICGYQYGHDASGDHVHVDNAVGDAEGWTLYVREYTVGDDDTWEEVYDEDFDNHVAFTAALDRLKAKYPDADVDLY